MVVARSNCSRIVVVTTGLVRLSVCYSPPPTHTCTQSVRDRYTYRRTVRYISDRHLAHALLRGGVHSPWPVLHSSRVFCCYSYHSSVAPAHRPPAAHARNRQTDYLLVSYISIPAGYCHTNAHYAGGVNNYLNSNHTKYWAQFCGRFFAFFENFRRKFANLVAPPTDGTTNRLVRC